MPRHRSSFPTGDAPNLDPDLDDEIMRGSPFAIPPSPNQSKATLAVVMESGDLRTFFAAIALIFALVAVVGISVLPGY